MADSEKQTGLGDSLKPFFHRASEAEERLSRLEAALATKKDAGNEELLKVISELQSKLEATNVELVSESEKVLENLLLKMLSSNIEFNILFGLLRRLIIMNWNKPSDVWSWQRGNYLRYWLEVEILDGSTNFAASIVAHILSLLLGHCDFNIHFAQFQFNYEFWIHTKMEMVIVDY
ncbi:hypothetical protein G4B88_029533 [Cannabis sativa]|uniref:Uncharacterized protein n=1 Tax=Cannabis sativa TaxID=3483 RepID=A0A7J6EAG0_CANSA|nr:hypothetical protein G4B88_029533 [Cannabis sativa]